MRISLLVLLPALTGCADLFGDRDAHQPGTPLGTFHVVATRKSNGCGEGALGTTPRWEFDVDLARDVGVLFWNNGATVLQGALDDDGVTFALDASVLVDMRTEEAPGAPCSVERRDAARGVLDDTGEEVKGFAGALGYDFVPTDGSLCADLVDGPAPVFASLPCGMKYDLVAERIAPPPE